MTVPVQLGIPKTLGDLENAALWLWPCLQACQDKAWHAQIGEVLICMCWRSGIHPRRLSAHFGFRGSSCKCPVRALL